MGQSKDSTENPSFLPQFLVALSLSLICLQASPSCPCAQPYAQPYAQKDKLSAEYLRKTIITDPAISRRCHALIKQRDQKVKHKQRIMSLIERNSRLIKRTPPSRKSLLDKLRNNFKSLSRELRHSLGQIQNREENLIRKGCPGVTL